jgi:hypothetical protein
MVGRQESTHTDETERGFTKTRHHKKVSHTHTRARSSSGKKIGGGGVVTELDDVKTFRMRK